MIIGCKEYAETICPDFPDKCMACGAFVDKRKEGNMNARCYYYIKYKRFDNGRWESAISLITGKRIKFTDRQSARDYMKFLYDRGFDVELHRDDMKTWIEKMERGVDCGTHDCYN